MGLLEKQTETIGEEICIWTHYLNSLQCIYVKNFKEKVNKNTFLLVENGEHDRKDRKQMKVDYKLIFQGKLLTFCCFFFSYFNPVYFSNPLSLSFLHFLQDSFKRAHSMPVHYSIIHAYPVHLGILKPASGFRRVAILRENL